MKIIKCTEDIEQIEDPDHQEIITEYFKNFLGWETPYEYVPEDDGWTVYFEKGDNLFEDNDEAYLSKGARYIYHDYWGEGGTGWEAVEKIEELFIVTVLLNNQFGITYFIPDEPWLDSELKEKLEEECID